MPQQVAVSVENNFTKGLITESTGLNFPENAATDTFNCEYTLVGDVTRRLGINNEVNAAFDPLDNTNSAFNTFVWTNVGGDGVTKWLVRQIGYHLNFFSISAVTTSNSLSSNLLPYSVSLLQYTAIGNVFDQRAECEFSSANGNLFVFHPTIDPLLINFSASTGTLSVSAINIQIRDFTGLKDSLQTSTRPAFLSDVHQYNLQNQGWISAQPWQATSTTPYPIGTTGTATFVVASGITGITPGQTVSIVFTGTSFPGIYPPTGSSVAVATITSYSGSNLNMTITSAISGYSTGPISGPWSIVPISIGFITTFVTAAGVYPSNADVWWYFKDNTGAFAPSTTLANIALTTGNAPNGHYLLNAFKQDKTLASGINGLTTLQTQWRPSTGAWFAGRVWYGGVNDAFGGNSDTNPYSWTENIYFSQIVNDPSDAGNCFQVNDPTSETLNGLLPTDGGVITIQGSGRIYKLFPIANGLIVFTSNGVWFITGSQGIGFTANDYTVTKISSVKSISSTSFVDVLGLPYFWNEEGIYQVSQQQNGQLSVEPITVGTILTFFDEIPLICKATARGSYNPIDYVIQWVYKSVQPANVTDQYKFDTILNYNTYNKAFYPYSLPSTGPYYIHGVNYIDYSVIYALVPEPGFKYISSALGQTNYLNTFAEEYDNKYVDWGNVNYNSYFVTGYKIRGQGIKKFQPQYVQLWSRITAPQMGYSIQGIWDYGNTIDSHRWSTIQNINLDLLDQRYNVYHRRHKIRGHGYTLQFKVLSQPGKPFDIIGWAVVDTVNAGT